MIDNFALAVSHGLMIVAAWRLLSRPDLQDDAGGAGTAASGGWAALRKRRGRDEAGA